MIPRVGEAVRPGQPYRRRPGAYAVLRKGGLVLLTHQLEPEPEFQLPGGGVDPGEQPISALHREVYEETGWRMRLERRLGAFRRFTWMPEYELWAEKLCVVYLGTPVRRLGPPAEPGHSAHWMPLPLATELVGNDGDRMFLSRLGADAGVRAAGKLRTDGKLRGTADARATAGDSAPTSAPARARPGSPTWLKAAARATLRP